MKDIFVQHKVITVPATSGTLTQSILFKADDCYDFLTGIAAFINSIPTADEIKFSLRSDFESILSFSPSENWLKNPTSAAFNLQDVWKPLSIPAKGRNFYFEYKVTNTTGFTFTLLLKQSKSALDIIRYDEQCFDIVSPALGQGFEITLPSDYTCVKGVMLSGGQTVNANFVGFEIYDAGGQIVDPLPMSMLTPSINTTYDNGFYPLNFESKSKQIKVRLSELGALPATYVPTNYTVTFLLIDKKNV